MQFWQRSLITLAAMMAVCLSAELAASELIREFRGTRSTTTAEFEVRAPWILDWRVTSDYSGSMGFGVSLTEAGTGIHHGTVVSTKFAGDGVRLFDEGGKYQFRIDATLANWTLRVEQLSRDEAERYQPK